MFEIIEIIGTSSENYSAAVANAVEQAGAQSMDVHFVEVLQQRGSVRNGKISEYQAVVKVAGKRK